MFEIQFHTIRRLVEDGIGRVWLRNTYIHR